MKQKELNKTLREEKTRGGTVNDRRFTPPANICFRTIFIICRSSREHLATSQREIYARETKLSTNLLDLLQTSYERDVYSNELKFAEMPLHECALNFYFDQDQVQYNFYLSQQSNKDARYFNKLQTYVSIGFWNSICSNISLY